MARKIRQASRIADDAGGAPQHPVEIAAATAPSQAFDILSCETSTRGTVVVSFALPAEKTPRFWFESRRGDVYSVLPVSLEFAGSNGINLVGVRDRSPDWTLRGEGTSAYIGKNLSPDWSLPNVDTFYISSPPTDDTEEPRSRAMLNDPITGDITPIRASRRYHLEILAAAHRCTAWISVECLSAAGDVILEESKRVGDGFIGGVRASDYDRVGIEFKSPANASFARISVIKAPTFESEAGFVFFARPALAQLPAAGGIKTVSLSILSQLRQNPDLEIFSASLAVPPELCKDREQPVTLAVAVGSETRRVPDLDVNWNNMITVDHCWLDNGTLRVIGTGRPLAGDEAKIGVFVDGQLSVERTVKEPGTFDWSISLAWRHLDGKPHMVEVRAMPGQFCLARTFGIVPFNVAPWQMLQEYARGPFSLTVSPAAEYHYQSFRAWLSHPERRELKTLTALNDELLQGFRRRTTYPKIAFPAVENPTVSVVVPVHNKFEITYFCLCSLLFAYNETSFEVIVVDDGSDDATCNIQDFVAGISVVRHNSTLGFVDSCNDGATVARGDYIFLLNNDTEVTAGCIDELVKVFSRFDRIGIAGAKLLYPNGTLQEAGGIVWQSGVPWNVGRDGNPREPQFCYLRAADYVSGAALLIGRELWEQVGGFSAEFAPGYYEDVDLAMKVRERGLSVVYVPSAVVFHYEGRSAGTDLGAGMKRFQKVNAPKFKRKWSKFYSTHGKEGVRPDLEKDREATIRVLMLDNGFPQIDADAGSYAVFQEIRLLQSLGAKVTFLPHNRSWMDRHTRILEEAGVECLYAPFVMDIEAFLREHAPEYDLFYLVRFRVAEAVTDLIRRYAPAAKILLNVIDLHFLREMREAGSGTSGYSFERAQETREAELKTIGGVDLALTYTDVEAAVIQSHLMNRVRVAKLPWVLDLDQAPRPAFAATKDILFLGGFLHHPNGEAVKFFARMVMPRLLERLPDVRFRVVGSNAPPDILELASDNIEIVGFVRDLDALFASSRVYVAPLLAGAGIKGKVLEGMARGIPTVLSPIAAEGTDLTNQVDCLIARTVDEWVEAIVRLYTDEALWISIGDGAKERARQQYSFTVGQTMMREALAMVDLFPHASGLYYKQARP